MSNLKQPPWKLRRTKLIIVAFASSADDLSLHLMLMVVVIGQMRLSVNRSLHGSSGARQTDLPTPNYHDLHFLVIW